MAPTTHGNCRPHHNKWACRCTGRQQASAPGVRGHSNASNSGCANGESTWVVTNGQLSLARGEKCGVWQGHPCTP